MSCILFILKFDDDGWYERQLYGYPATRAEGPGLGEWAACQGGGGVFLGFGRWGCGRFIEMRGFLVRMGRGLGGGGMGM